MKKILLINGPNLNLLGEREPDLYGKSTLKDIEDTLKERIKGSGIDLVCFQSNHEGEIIDFLQAECSKGTGIILNAGAFTHTSIAIRDTLIAKEALIVEVHLSNIYKRESFRKRSYFSDISAGVIAGLGPGVYEYALDFLLKK
ncbi:MAG: type II 3-dehydroquinate dehydratase [Spirochaetes bacterium]|nr:type II 3-dehydroquinate dehydratase [Spirochaetota bacterium]MCK5268796.1 type II 3-dehydroquinate dehydratase [Spirochaetota bacterium]